MPTSASGSSAISGSEPRAGGASSRSQTSSPSASFFSIAVAVTSEAITSAARTGTCAPIALVAAAVISYSLYVQDVHEKVGRAQELLPFTVPFVIFVILRYHLLVERGSLGEKPEEAIFRDGALLASLVGFGAVALAAFYWEG